MRFRRTLRGIIVAQCGAPRAGAAFSPHMGCMSQPTQRRACSMEQPMHLRINPWARPRCVRAALAVRRAAAWLAIAAHKRRRCPPTSPACGSTTPVRAPSRSPRAAIASAAAWSGSRTPSTSPRAASASAARRSSAICSRRPNNAWEDGWIYNPEDEERFSAALKLANANTLLVTGYLGIKLLGETFTWKRSTAPLDRCGPANRPT